MAAPARQIEGAEIRYFDPAAERNKHGALEYGSGQASLGRGHTWDLVTKPYPVSVLDARAPPGGGGLESWNFEKHGLAYIKAPAIVDFRDAKQVRDSFQSRFMEVVKKHTGASRVFWMGHMRRTEQNNGEARSKTTTKLYATLAHSDFGPAFEPLFRKMLVGRCGLSEAEAQRCGLCVLNYWAPVERPAYKDPLALLDASSIREAEKETVPFMVMGNVGYERAPGAAYDPTKIPLATQDAPSLGAVYAPHHRWVYCSDMQPDEAVIFKQYDFRPGVATRATFHHAVNDPFHENWKECPGRRSVECRALLVFDPPSTGSSSSTSKL